MANTVTYGRRSVTIVFDGSTAWDAGMDMVVTRMTFEPAAASDVLTVRNGSATGSIEAAFSTGTGTDDQKSVFFTGQDGLQGYRFQPYVKGDEVTANVKLIVQYA